MNLYSVLYSFFDLTKNIIFAKKAQVLFYYPQHFNRSNFGTNPFFDSLLKTCEDNGIRYKLIEEPDGGTDKPRNKNAIKGDFLYLLILCFRKLCRIIYKQESLYNIEKKVAKLIDVISFRRFRFPAYVSISGSLNEFFLSICPNARVYEVQHGVVFSGKDSFFEPDGSLHPAYKDKRFNWLFWGEGYARSVMRGNENEMAGRVHVTGYPLALKSEFIPKSSFKEYIILISVRFTTDYTTEELQKKKDNLDRFLAELTSCDVKVLIKHHPRYNNVISLDDLYVKYPFVSATNESLSALQEKIFLQVTTDSTTAFEYAETGILTFFYSNADFMQKDNLFYKEYQYPLYLGLDVREVVNRLKNSTNYYSDSLTIRNWYEKFYTPYNEKEFLKLKVWQ